MVAADFNGDGLPDLAVTLYSSTTNKGELSILLGKGDGHFKALPVITAGFGPANLLLGDFNRDGKADLVVESFGEPLSSYTNGSIKVFLGLGDGRFVAPVVADTGQSAALATGDFNGDSKLDLIVAKGDEISSTISVSAGEGDGSFHLISTQPNDGPNPQFLLPVDTNGDDKLDLVIVNSGRRESQFLESNVSIWLGTGDGRFVPTKTAYWNGQHPFASAAAGDFNGDRRVDIVAASFGQPRAGAIYGGVTMLIGNGNGYFTDTNFFRAGPGPSHVVVADFDGDGAEDLAVGSSRVYLAAGRGDGNFLEARPLATSDDASLRVVNLAVRDFDGDGAPDIAVLTGADSNFSRSKVSVLLNRIAPRLTVAHEQGRVLLTWPSLTNSSWVLESTETLGQAGWSRLSSVVDTNGPTMRTAVSTDGLARLFRLHKTE
jgi:hypothetical protein